MKFATLVLSLAPCLITTAATAATKPFVGELRYEITSTDDAGEVTKEKLIVLVKPPLLRMEMPRRGHVDIVQLDLEHKTSILARKGEWSRPSSPLGREGAQQIVRRWHKKYSCARDGNRLTVTSQAGEIDFECEFDPELGSSRIAWGFVLVSFGDLKCELDGVPRFMRERRETRTNEWRLLKARKRKLGAADFQLPPVGTDEETGEMFFKRREPAR